MAYLVNVYLMLKHPRFSHKLTATNCIFIFNFPYVANICFMWVLTLAYRGKL